MKAIAAMLVTAVAADTAFLQMKLSTKRVHTQKWGGDDDDDDMTYGADGAYDEMIDGPIMGVHEFLNAEEEEEVDDSDEGTEDLAQTEADDEATNFGEDADESDD